jgi:hypothetical protein
VVVSKEQCKSMGAKLSLLPGTGETDPQGFERVTLGSTQASAVGIGCQLIVRRRRHAARIARFATRRTGAVTRRAAQQGAHTSSL